MVFEIIVIIILPDCRLIKKLYYNKQPFISYFIVYVDCSVNGI